jgi:manganese-dependent ADP-ribose/CDP-alcohol diphosphatase
MWNYKEVLAVLREFKDVVVASFSGHAHKGGYNRDRTGIHFRVFEAALENPDPHKTYAMIDIHSDHLEIRGFGNCKSAVYEFDHQFATNTRV